MKGAIYRDDGTLHFDLEKAADSQDLRGVAFVKEELEPGLRAELGKANVRAHIIVTDEAYNAIIRGLSDSGGE